MKFYTIAGQSIFPLYDEGNWLKPLAYYSWPADLESNLDANGETDFTHAIERTEAEFLAEAAAFKQNAHTSTKSN